MFFIRPDASEALNEPGVKKAMGRYVGVVKNELPALFRISKTVPIKAGPLKKLNQEELLNLHGNAMESFRREKKKIDVGRPRKEETETSLIDLKNEILGRMVKNCNFCERRCGVDRTAGQKGFCGLSDKSYLSTESLHYGEEACLVPSHTLFFVGCNLRCVYCQNWTISRQKETGWPVNGQWLADRVKKRRVKEGSQNVNLVGGDPAPHLHTIMETVKSLDVNIPVVFNSNMYLTSEALGILDGAVDVYLTDFKYGNNTCARRLSKVDSYFDITTRNHLAAAKHGEVLIRHLVLPSHVDCCTKPVLEWIGKNLKGSVRVNIMDQYHPEFKARDYPDIDRRVFREEMKRAFGLARECGVTNLD